MRFKDFCSIIKQKVVKQSLKVINFRIKSSFLLIKENIAMPSSPQSRFYEGSPARADRSPSPSRNDIDFLTRKIHKLEADNNQMGEELHRARNRLRKAEDYEIKYDLSLNQKNILEAEVDKQGRIIQEQAAQLKELTILCQEKEAFAKGFYVEKKGLLEEIQRWRRKATENDEAIASVRAEQEYRLNQKLALELDFLKKNFSDQEENYRNKVRLLEIQLSEKKAVEETLSEKQDKVFKENEVEMERLRGIIQSMRDDHLTQMKQKNQEMVSVARKFQTLFNYEIEKLTQSRETNADKVSVELDGLRGLLELKNQEIENILNDSAANRKAFMEEKSELQRQISLLKEKIYELQRQNEQQIQNLKDRLVTLHRNDIEELKKNHQKLNLNLEENNRQLQGLLRKREEQIKEIESRRLLEKNKLQEVLKQKNKEIDELRQKLRESANLSTNEINNLHSSFHKITTEKQSMSNEYQSTFDFLNNQINKLTNSNELKNQEIKELHLDLAEVKKNRNQHIKDLEQKWKLERKDREAQRDRERNLRQAQEDEFREKEEKWRHTQRTLEKEKQKQQRQKIKLKVQNTEHERTIERLNRYIRDNDERLKQEMHKNQSSFIETGAVRRELNGELERQRSQFETIKALEMDQIHRKYEISISALTNENERLKTEINNLKIDFDKLEEETKRLHNTKKNYDRRNKEKMVEYEQKMAALNAEISLTQNLYQSFINAKSKIADKR